MARHSSSIGWGLLALLLVALALARPLDHDESQYVAAATLTARGLLPYRDYAYLQTPLQPFAFAPVALVAGLWTWPMLRIVNALLGWGAILGVADAARRAGASARMARVAALLFAGCDITLFGIGTARNDALPLALFVAALWLIAGGARRRRTLAATGALLAAAAAAKISYAIPALAYGLWLLPRPRAAAWLAAGVLPVAAGVAWTAWLAPAGFVFGTLTFPAHAPAEYYAPRPWKLSLAAKAVDTVKFLALGAALPALAIVARATIRRPTLFEVIALAGLVAALLPFPTWRQYLLPLLPALFIRLALVWTQQPPVRRDGLILAPFVVAGLVPSIVAAASGTGMMLAARETRAIGAALAAAGVSRGSAVATLSPQFLPGTGYRIDPRFAAGPFYARSHRLLTAPDERALTLMSLDRPGALPAAVLVGGEAGWTSGDAALDTRMAALARRGGLVAHPVAGGRFTLFTRR